MLYTLRELQCSLLAPLSEAAKAAAAMYAAPGPFAHLPFARTMAATFELCHRLTRRYPPPTFGINHVTVDGVEVPVQERVVVERPFCRLVRFERLMPEGLRDRAPDPVVLVFAPLSGHFATLLRDTVRRLLPEHDVYITDWVDAKVVPVTEGPFSLDDYVAYARDFIRKLGPEVHVLAVCQPTVPVLAAVALLEAEEDPCAPRSLTLMGGPIDARISPTQVTRFALEHPISWFEDYLIFTVPEGYPGAGRRVYPGFLQLGAFMSMNTERHARAYRDFFFDVAMGREERAEAHRRFYDEYNAVLDMPAEYYLDTVRAVFQEFALAEGRFMVRIDGTTKRVRPETIHRTWLLTVEGEKDDITGLGQTEAAHKLCSGLAPSRRRHLVAASVGHYGLFSGHRWRENIYPAVREFIRDSIR